MNKVVYLVPLLLSVLFIGASYAIPPKDAALFVAGFAAGISVCHMLFHATQY